MPERVLVTGASGFIGKHVPSLLAARGYEVHLVGRAAGPAIDLSGHAYHQADLLQDVEVQTLMAKIRPSRLLHLAWYVEPGKYWNSLSNLEWAAASLRLFQVFSEHGGKRFVGAGTCAEYDWSHETLVPGQTPLNPSTLYGAAKAHLGQLLTTAAADAKVSVAWGRIFFPFGPGEHVGRLLPQVIRGLLRNEDIPLTKGLQVRDFVFSEDVAQIFAALVDGSQEGAVNVASGEGRSIRGLLELVVRHLGEADHLRFGARPDGNDASPRMLADVTVLKDVAAGLPLIGVEEGIVRTIAWWKNQAGLLAGRNMG